MSIVGSIRRHENFASKFVIPRNVDVWLPPHYSESTAAFPVIYMHDGQNLFEPISSISGASWELDKAITRFMDAGKMKGVILVGIWNHGDIGGREYMPQKPYWSLALRKHHESFINRAGGEPL